MRKQAYLRRLLKSVCTAAATFSFLTSFAANEITVYKHCNYDASGYAVSLSVGTYTTAQLTALGILNNDISSLRVTSGFEIVLFDTDNLTGTSVTVSSAGNGLQTL